MALEFDYSKIIKQHISRLSEEEFWKLVSTRLNIPLSCDQVKEFEITAPEQIKLRQYWTEDRLIEELFLQLASTKIIVNKRDVVGDDDNCKSVTVHKYYNQAFRLRNWIPLAKPVPEFIVNISDLELRTIAELKALSYSTKEEENKGDPNYVLKQAVGRIFENIDARQYHLSIARKLKVRLDA